MFLFRLMLIFAWGQFNYSFKRKAMNKTKSRTTKLRNRLGKELISRRIKVTRDYLASKTVKRENPIIDMWDNYLNFSSLEY